MRPHLLVFTLPLGLSACGGCPWTETSEVTIDPATACLALQVADSSGTPPSTGCVNPVLYGQNGCGETLTIPAAWSATGADAVFDAGAEVETEIDLGSTAAQDGVYEFAVSATMGGDPITIWFTAE